MPWRHRLTNADRVSVLAGIAMYSSILKTKAQPGDWLVLLGAGGGLGHLYA